MTRRRGCSCWTQRYWRGTGARFRGCSGVQCLATGVCEPFGGTSCAGRSDHVPAHSETAVAVPCFSASVSFPLARWGTGIWPFFFLSLLVAIFPLLFPRRILKTFGRTRLIRRQGTLACALRITGTGTDNTMNELSIGARLAAATASSEQTEKGSMMEPVQV